MNRPEVFEKSVNALVQAYNEGPLQHMNCQACAVGNLVAAGMGYTYHVNRSLPVGPYIKWVDSNGRFVWDAEWFLNLNFDGKSLDGQRQIESTGYMANELSLIEDRFENQFSKDAFRSSEKGLEAVYLCLCDIHEVPEVDRVDFDVLFVPKECGEEVQEVEV